jgi:hypothetical protein
MKKNCVASAVIAGIMLIAAAVQGLPADGPYALIFVIDGIPTNLFRQMMEDGELPNFREHIYERGIYSRHHMAVFPPLTFPAMASIFSGRYPATHGVPNFFWVSREEAMYTNYLSVHVGRFQRDVHQNVSFLFDYFPCDRTLSFGLPVEIGGYYTKGLIGSFVDFSREARDYDYAAKAIEQEHAIEADMFVKPLKFVSLLNPSKDTNIISLLNPFSRAGAAHYAVRSFSASERMMCSKVPTAVLYYEWATDQLGHQDGTNSEEVRESLIKADEQFGRLVRAYQEAGLYDRTFFVLLSDHSQIPVQAHYVPIDRTFAQWGFKTILISHEIMAQSGLSGLIRMPPLLIGAGSLKGYNCALGTAGGGAVVAYLSRNGGTDVESWKEEVYYNEILQYPVAPGVKVNIADLINSIHGMNFFFVREAEFLPDKPHVTRIVAGFGSSLVTAIVRDKKAVQIKYEVIEGNDPLGYAGNPALARFIAQGFHGDREWLNMTTATEHPDAPIQIAQIMELDRSGSIIMIPDDLHTFNSRVWAKHGGLSAKEMLATFAIAGPGIRRGTIENSRVVDFTPTFLHLMGRDVPPQFFDGIVLKDIVRGN